MSLAPPRPESEMLDLPITRMATRLFDEKPAALRGSLQVVLAMLIGVVMGNTLNLIV